MSLINQSPRFLNSRFRQNIQVKRLQGKHSETGFNASYQEETLVAIVIPTSPSDVLLLPEGERYLPSIKVFTLKALNTGDLVQYKGTAFKIKTAANWEDYGYANHIAVRHLPTAKADSTGFTIT